MGKSGNKSPTINEDLLDKTVNTIVYSNDASASVFGWDFQFNAALFLALHYIDNLEGIKVESKNQDIELTLKESKKVYGQAKSARDFSLAKNNKKKIKDGLLSLAKTQAHNNEGIFIYISNIPNVFLNENNMFDNDVKRYVDMDFALRQQVDKLFDDIVDDIQIKIDECTNKNKKTINVLKQYKKCVEEFDKDKLCFSVIVPYVGNDRTKYKRINEKLQKTLLTYFSLNEFQVWSLCDKLFDFYHQYFLEDATIEDEEQYKKEISLKQFVWPAIALTVDNIDIDQEKWSSYHMDESTLNEFERCKKMIEIRYHERFELTTKVITDYIYYRKQSTKHMEIEKDFANEKYKDYIYEFDKYEFNDEMKKQLMVWLLYRIVTNNSSIGKIVKGVKSQK